ncbi:MAG: hypothetical protein EHM56_10445, partial [Chloroflexi bacterium]
EPQVKTLGWARWSRPSLHKLLKNETYAGVWHYGKEGKDELIPVEVPAIVSRETWDAAQVRLAKNRADSPRNRKYNYLMGRRIRCGVCGLKIAGQSKKDGEKVYTYYVCPSNKEYARECNMKSVRGADLDAAVWEWVKSFLTNPKALAEGLEGYREDCAKESLPVRERLAVVSALIDDNQAQLNKLLDLYLSGEFTREMWTERKARLEATIAALEREQAGLVAHLKEQSLTDEQIQTLMNFAAMVSENLEAMDNDFDAKRRLIEELDVQATLTMEDGEKVAYVSCIVGEDAFCIVPMGTRDRSETRWACRPRGRGRCPPGPLPAGCRRCPSPAGGPGRDGPCLRPPRVPPPLPGGSSRARWAPGPRRSRPGRGRPA